jgi:GT2 family glycosyltransferase
MRPGQPFHTIAILRTMSSAPSDRLGRAAAEPAPAPSGPAPPSSLSVSLVTWRPDLDLLAQTVESLAAAIVEAERALLLKGVGVTLVDNTGPREAMAAIRHAIGHVLDDAAVETDYRSGQGNIGYGAAHNLALLASGSDYHLVLNPDVILDRFALANALRFMQAHPDVGLLSPSARGPDGKPQALAQRYPSVADLALRGFAPRPVRSRFRHRLDRYVGNDAGSDAHADTARTDLEVASGCFMFLRRALVQQLGGFDRRFFLYFEDFDLAWRVRARAKVARVPDVRIVHFGGGAARKGIDHIAMFARSAWTFYRKHGWRFV